jgi:hypothetical protein
VIAVPTGLASSNITDTTFDLSWDHAIPASGDWFTSQTDVVASTWIESNAHVFSVITASAEVTALTGGMEYELNDSGTWINTTGGFVAPNDSMKVRLMSSTSDETQVSGSITVGGVSDTFAVTTVAAVGVVDFTESFETGPLAWPGTGVNGHVISRSNADISRIGSDAHSGTYCIYMNNVDNGTLDDFITITIEGTHPAGTLSYWVKGDSSTWSVVKQNGVQIFEDLDYNSISVYRQNSVGFSAGTNSTFTFVATGEAMDKRVYFDDIYFNFN